MGLAHDVMDAAIGLWRNGAFPSGAVKLQGRVSPEERTRLREQLSEQFSGRATRAKVMVLDQGSEWEAMATDPHDAETLETRRFMVAEICRIFEVPPPLIQSYEFNTFTNSQEASRWFSNFHFGRLGAEVRGCVRADLAARVAISRTGHVQLHARRPWRAVGRAQNRPGDRGATAG